MSVHSGVRDFSRHLCSSEADDMDVVMLNKCRTDSTEEASVESGGPSPKPAGTPALAPVKVARRTASSPTRQSPLRSPPLRRLHAGAERPSSSSPLTAPAETTAALGSRQRRQSRNGPSSVPTSALRSPPQPLPRLSSAQSSPDGRRHAVPTGTSPPQALRPLTLPPASGQSAPLVCGGPLTEPGAAALAAGADIRWQASLLASTSATTTTVPTTTTHANTTATAAPAAPAADAQAALPPHHRPVPSMEEEPTCCICMEAYSTENPVCRGACAHHFHLPCLLGWKQRSNACPMCCAETLRGIGDIDEVDSSHSRKHDKATGESDGGAAASSPTPPLRSGQAATPAPFIDDDEEIALMLQRKYLRRAARKVEERRRAALATERHRNGCGSSQVDPTSGQPLQLLSLHNAEVAPRRSPVAYAYTDHTPAQPIAVTASGPVVPSDQPRHRAKRCSDTRREREGHSKGGCFVM